MGEPPPPPRPAWTPGGARPAPQPVVVWPRIFGVLVALGAQAALYLALRHLATAHMPAWAHHRHMAPLPWPSVVPVDVVAGQAATAGVPAPVAMPAFIAAPVVVLVPPPLGAFDVAP